MEFEEGGIQNDFEPGSGSGKYRSTLRGHLIQIVTLVVENQIEELNRVLQREMKKFGERMGKEGFGLGCALF